MDFIVPIDTIRRRYPGGWEKSLEDHRQLIGSRIWYDDYLFRDGGMAPSVIGELVGHRNAKGFDLRGPQKRTPARGRGAASTEIHSARMKNIAIASLCSSFPGHGAGRRVSNV
jgi:hypothetical protein